MALTPERIYEIEKATSLEYVRGAVENFDIAFARAIEAEVRRDALEEAAKVCDEEHYDWRFGDGDDSTSGPKECAAAIRKLKEDIQ